MGKNDDKIPKKQPGRAVRGDTALGEFVSAVKKELQAAIADAVDETPFFQLDRVDLEISFAMTMGGESGFNLVVAKADGKLEAHQTQKVLLSLTPVAERPPGNHGGTKDTRKAKGDDDDDSRLTESDRMALRHRYQPDAPLLQLPLEMELGPLYTMFRNPRIAECWELVPAGKSDGSFDQDGHPLMTFDGKTLEPRRRVELLAGYEGGRELLGAFTRIGTDARLAGTDDGRVLAAKVDELDEAAADGEPEPEASDAPPVDAAAGWESHGDEDTLQNAAFTDDGPEEF